MLVYSATALMQGIDRIFQACQVPARDSRTVAEHLVEAECCGIVSHGIIRVPQYVELIRAGHVNPAARLTLLRETPATAMLDGQHGFGQVMALAAMDAAIVLARQGGIGCVTLANCTHTGRLGHYTLRAAGQGMIGLMMVNTAGFGQWVAPFGGREGRLATNPLSIAVPSVDDAPLVLDMSTSAVPEGRIRALMTVGRSIPEGWVIDHQGHSTTQPSDLYGPPRGALLPFGGHKGFGLAMMVEVLAGVLSGAGCCTKVDAPLAGESDGVFIVAIDATAFGPLATFRETVGQLTRHVKSSAPAPDVDEVFTPGEIEARTHRQRLAAGVPIDPATWSLVSAAASSVGLDAAVAFGPSRQGT